MEPRSIICLNCQTPLRLEPTQRRPDNANSDKKGDGGEIFESLSGHSRNLMRLINDAQFPSDAPVCKECSDALCREMDIQLSSLEDERAKFQTYIDFLNENHKSSEIQELNAKLQNLKDEEKTLELQLQKLVIEEDKLDIELQKKRKQSEESNIQSVNLWKKYRDNLRKILDDQDELAALNAEAQYARVQHRKLIDTNVLDLCFHIWIDETMGEINGFRLGYAKEKPVEWIEINAALGQIVLLLEVLLERLGIKHHELYPVPMGSHSLIKSRKNGIEAETFQLYGQGTPFVGTKFPSDSGIRKYLELLAFVHKELNNRNKAFKPKYQIQCSTKAVLIDNGMAYDAGMLFNHEARWTRAMIMLLSNLKVASAQCDSLRSSD